MARARLAAWCDWRDVLLPGPPELIRFLARLPGMKRLFTGAVRKSCDACAVIKIRNNLSSLTEPLWKKIYTPHNEKPMKNSSSWHTSWGVPTALWPFPSVARKKEGYHLNVKGLCTYQFPPRVPGCPERLGYRECMRALVLKGTDRSQEWGK